MSLLLDRTVATHCNGGTLNVAGASATIATVNTNGGANVVNVTAAPAIPFVLHDDDDVSLPHSPSFGLMEDKFRPAFILPLADGGTALSNNKDTIAFRRNAGWTPFLHHGWPKDSYGFGLPQGVAVLEYSVFLAPEQAGLHARRIHAN